MALSCYRFTCLAQGTSSNSLCTLMPMESMLRAQLVTGLFMVLPGNKMKKWTCAVFEFGKARCANGCHAASVTAMELEQREGCDMAPKLYRTKFTTIVVRSCCFHRVLTDGSELPGLTPAIC